MKKLLTCFSKAMTTLTNLQLITPRHFTKPNPPFQISRRVAWRIHDGGKGFSSSSPKGGARKSNTPTNKENRGGAGAGGDDKIPDVVWERMVPRILSYVGVPLAVGFALLKGFDVAIDNGTWNVPKWLPFVTTFITFGASALGIAYGSLSTSLDAEEEGSLLGFEQVQKNWVEMWEEEDAA